MSGWHIRLKRGDQRFWLHSSAPIRSNSIERICRYSIDHGLPVAYGRRIPIQWWDDVQYTAQVFQSHSVAQQVANCLQQLEPAGPAPIITLEEVRKVSPVTEALVVGLAITLLAVLMITFTGNLRWSIWPAFLGFYLALVPLFYLFRSYG